jgi:predicted transcriptional regulator with HTH domain
VGPLEYQCVNYKQHLAYVFHIQNSRGYFDEISYPVEGSFTNYITEVLKFTGERYTRQTAHKLLRN